MTPCNCLCYCASLSPVFSLVYLLAHCSLSLSLHKFVLPSELWKAHGHNCVVCVCVLGYHRLFFNSIFFIIFCVIYNRLVELLLILPMKLWRIVLFLINALIHYYFNKFVEMSPFLHLTRLCIIAWRHNSHSQIMVNDVILKRNKTVDYTPHCIYIIHYTVEKHQWMFLCKMIMRVIHRVRQSICSLRKNKICNA